MVRILTTILALQLALWGVPMVASAEGNLEGWTENVDAVGEITIKVSGQSVRVLNAQGKTFEVYSITGTKVMSVAIDANDKNISLNLNRGWYILKIGNVTRKIALQ